MNERGEYMYRSEEDYLKQIYELSVEQGKVQIKTGDLAESMGYSDQSINEKIKKLVSKDYLIFEPYKGVSLTEKGIDEAIRMIRAHRLWEVFLYKELNFPWMALHKDAEELEHASSPEVIEKLYEYLGEPEYCYHGNPIPDLNDKMAPIAQTPLSEAHTGSIFEVNRVKDEVDLLTLLDELGIRIGSKLKVVEVNDFAGYIKVEIDGVQKQITNQISKMIYTF